jgi:uncharacterized membrane protein YesL
MSIAGALRQAVADFYFNSWRLAPANVVWGLGFLVVLFLGGAFPPAFALAAVLTVPLAGIHRMAALIARDEPASFSDFVAGMRRFGAAALGVGAVATVLAVVFTTNVFVGLENGGPVGWFLSAMALYGNVTLAMLLVALWPLLVDPRREALSIRRRLALAGVVVIGRPGRLLILTAVIGLLLAVSTVLIAALITISVAYVSLVASRYVLPLADQLEERLAARRAA